MGLIVMPTTVGFSLQMSYEPFKLKNNWILLLSGTLKVVPSDWGRRGDCAEAKQSPGLWREGAFVAGDEWIRILLLKEKWSICLKSLVHQRAHCPCTRHDSWLNSKADVDIPHWKIGSVSCCNIFIPRETKNFRSPKHSNSIAGDF